jgi:hypothetical protein
LFNSSHDKSTQGVRKLWQCLVSKKNLQDDFVHFIFKQKSNSSKHENSTTAASMHDGNYMVGGYDFTPSGTANTVIGLGNASGASAHNSTQQPTAASHQSYKIIHKDQDAIHSFCLNEKDSHVISVCTNKEILEIDFQSLLRSNAGSDNNAVDESANNSQESQTQQVEPIFDQNVFGTMSDVLAANRSYTALRRPMKDVKKLASHPTLPYYLSGTSEGLFFFVKTTDFTLSGWNSRRKNSIV